MTANTNNSSDWQLDVVRQLATISTRIGALTDQVARQNGNVARLWEQMDAAKKELAEHPGKCPLGERVESLEQDRAASVAVRAAVGVERAKWHQRIHPLVSAAVTVLAMLVLERGPEIVKALK